MEQVKPTLQPKVSTRYPKSIRDPSVYPYRYLKPVSNNKKLGRGKKTVEKGKWKGFPMFSLTLVERETCPNECHHWDDCYGDNMPFAHRFTPNKDLENGIKREISELCGKYPAGIVVRLHVLGDFYSLDYCALWLRLLIEHPNLHVFGYTSRTNCKIGYAIQTIRLMIPDRFWVRVSSNKSWSPYEPQILYAAKEPFEGITCPEQLGKTSSCLSCGLCWSINKTIVFKDH
jgi:hypothetical protein